MPETVLIIASNAKSLLLFRYDLIVALQKQGLKIIALAPELEINNEIFEALSAIKVRCLGYPISNRGLNPCQDLKTLFKLYQLIKKIQPDVILSYTIKPVIYGSLAAKFARIPKIFSMITGLGTIFTEEHYQKHFIKNLVKWLYKIALKTNQSVFFQNPDDLRLFVDSQIIPKNKSILINGSGINLKVYKYVPVDVITFPIRFLLIARLLPEKGIMEFLEAAAQIKQKLRHVKFTVIGPAQNHHRSKEMLFRMQEVGVTYLGEVCDVKPYLQGCDIYVLPSYREGTPRSVLEAMAVGRPIITTDAPGCRETVVEGENGFLIPVKNIDALVEKMEYFLQNPERISEMGLASRRLVEAKFDVNQVNTEILKIILENKNA